MRTDNSYSISHVWMDSTYICTYIWINAILATLYHESLYDPMPIAPIPPILYFAVYIRTYICTYVHHARVYVYVRTYEWQRCNLSVGMLRCRSMCVRTYVDYLVNYMIASYTVSALETVTYVRTFTRACVVRRGSSLICKWETSNVRDCYCTPFLVNVTNRCSLLIFKWTLWSPRLRLLAGITLLHLQGI